ncbi:MAG: PorP/SprF family type IX secretion system membrane protein [Bacteroidia bacterium]|nr:PorP/SprF family type IX secretion system membrane protein [Bacteroidia bacterium]
MPQRLTLLLFIVAFFKGHSQDAYFSNTNQSLLYLNPSFAGTNGLFRIQTIAEVQDYNSKRSFVTSFTSLDAYIGKIKGGLAFSYLYDDYSKGQLKTSAYSLSYAQHIFLKEKKFRVIPSVQGSFQSKQLNVDNINYGDTINRRSHTIFNVGNALPSPDKSFFDLSIGILAQNRESSFGVAVFHINQPDEGLLGELNLPLRINVHGAYNFRLNDETNLSLAGCYVNQNAFWDAHLNLNLLWSNELFIGAGIWRSKVFTANLGFQANVFRLGFGYNYNLNSSLDPWIYGKNSLELMLGFYFENKKSENSTTADWRMW